MTVNHSTCADMGYAGLFGGNPGAAMFSSVWYEYNYNTQSAQPTCTATRAIRATTRPGTGPTHPTTATCSATAGRGGAELSGVIAAREHGGARVAIGALGLHPPPAAELVTRPPGGRGHDVASRDSNDPVRSPAKGPILRGHRVGMFIDGGYCLGGPEPEYDHVKLIELPRTSRRPFAAAVITAYRLWPERSSYTPTPGPEYGKCVTDRPDIFHRVKTKRPALESASLSTVTSRRPARSGRRSAAVPRAAEVQTPCAAEGVGFEPTSRLATATGFQDRRIQPLCHPSGSTRATDARRKGGVSMDGRVDWMGRCAGCWSSPRR